MKKKTINPTRSQFNILRQICNFIPAHEVSKIARATGAEDKSRTFKPWSHVVSLVYGQLTNAMGQLAVDQTHDMAPWLKGARLVLGSGSPSYLGDFVGWNKIANLAQDVELRPCWVDR